MFFLCFWHSFDPSNTPKYNCDQAREFREHLSWMLISFCTTSSICLYSHCSPISTTWSACVRACYSNCFELNLRDQVNSFSILIGCECVATCRFSCSKLCRAACGCIHKSTLDLLRTVYNLWIAFVRYDGHKQPPPQHINWLPNSHGANLCVAEPNRKVIAAFLERNVRITHNVLCFFSLAAPIIVWCSMSVQSFFRNHSHACRTQALGNALSEASWTVGLIGGGTMNSAEKFKRKGADMTSYAHKALGNEWLCDFIEENMCERTYSK